MQSRRAFLQQTGALATASLFAQAGTTARSLPLGLQLFTMRAALAQDVPGTIARIAAIGYREVETYGFDDKVGRYYRMPPQSLRQLLADHGITSPSGHYDLNRYVSTPLDDLRRYVDRCIEGAKGLGHTYITWPWLDPQSRSLETFKIVAERLNVIGEQARAAGLQVAYHNHDFEFVDHNGRTGYDVILAETDPALVKLQMDLYWIARGSKLTAQQWFARQPRRFVMWHVKDVHKVSGDYTEVGNGTVDFKTIWPHAAAAGLRHFFVEQGGNFTHDPFRSIADSAQYVKRELLR